MKRYLIMFDTVGTIPTIRLQQRIKKRSLNKEGKFKVIDGLLIDMESPTYRNKEKYYYMVDASAQAFLTEGQANKVLTKEVVNDIVENNMFIQLSKAEQNKTDWTLIILMTIIAVVVGVACYFGGASTL